VHDSNHSKRSGRQYTPQLVNQKKDAQGQAWDGGIFQQLNIFNIVASHVDPDNIPLMRMVSPSWSAQLDVTDQYMQDSVLPKIRKVWHRLHPSELPGDGTPEEKKSKVYELNHDLLDGHYPFNQGNVHAALLEVPIHGDRKPKGIEVPTNLRALQPGQLAGELSHLGFEWSSIVGAAKKPDGAFLEGWFTHAMLCTWPVTVEKTPFLYALKKASCKI